MPCHIILYQPQIPPNTGNVIRLCANSGAELHLIEPMGFDLSDKQLRRAGLDYHARALLHTHASLEAYRVAHPNRRIIAVETIAQQRHTDVAYQLDDALLFGSETLGLPAEVLRTVPSSLQVRLPMRPSNRSLNLSNSVAVVVYEAWRQLGFCGETR